MLWWVFEEEEQIVAYAYPFQWKSRSGYRYTVGSSVYVAPKHQRKGIDLQLYKTSNPSPKRRSLSFCFSEYCTSQCAKYFVSRKIRL